MPELKKMEEIRDINRIAYAPSEREGKYLTFTLGREEYGIGILRVKEIIGMMPITCIPQTPNYVKGVINLRGKVIPVLDLRCKFGMEEVEYNERTCIIVVEIQNSSGSILTGIVVDAVSEVLNIRENEIEDTPIFNGKSVEYILGMAKTQGGVKILLDISKVVANGDPLLSSAQCVEN